MRPRDLETLEFPRLLDTIARLARCPAGRRAVLGFQPAAGGAGAERRLDTIEEMRALATEAGPPPVGDLPLVGPALAEAGPEGAVLEARRLAEVRDVLAAARHVSSHLRRDPDRFPHLTAEAAAIIRPALGDLDSGLARTLADTGLVRDDASPALAAARAVTRELRREMEERLERLVRDPDMADAVAETYVTIRNGRFVVPIRTAVARSIPGVIQDRSASGETVFLEPLFAVEINNRLLLATKDEEAEERRVRAELTALVRAAASDLEAVEHALGTIDALAAAAAFATRHGCTRPGLGAAEVALLAARHPLLLETGRRVVPIDLRIPAGRRGLAITGPNAGGKTVALKTLGLAVVMAHAGLPVPAADGSRLPTVDAVLADIGDEQSIERDLSTFSAHAENLAGIAAAARARALVLLDEPGDGTDPTEGAALAVGVVMDLLERGALVALTSHFPQVKTFALASHDLDVAAFDVDPATGAPRFQLRYHTVGQSLALTIARRHGLPPRALEVAERILAGESRDLARAIERLEESRAAYEAERADAERERARLSAAQAEAETLVADLRSRQRSRWRADLEESRRFLRDLEERGRALLDELRRRPEPGILRAFVREAADEVTAHERSAGAEPGPPAGGRAPAPGDLVEVVGRGIRGELLEIEGQRARLQRGGLRFEVPADQLRVVDGGPARDRIAVEVVRPASAEEEINLVGQRAGDAVEALGRFLDRAMRAGLAEVRVIHGVGTGALRRAVHEFLDGSPYCAGHRDADPGAGGVGVTIVELG